MKTIAADAKALKTTPVSSRFVADTRPPAPAIAYSRTVVATAPAKAAGGTAV